MSKIIDKVQLIEVVSNLNVNNDSHWNQAGGPNMTHIKEAMGKTVSRKQMGEAGLGEVTREEPYVAPPVENETSSAKTTLNETSTEAPTDPPAEEMEPIVDLQTGEPNPENIRLMEAASNPAKADPAEIGAALIVMLDQISLLMTREVRTRQSELYEVIQLYQAERPTIIAKQKRLAVRAAQRR